MKLSISIVLRARMEFLRTTMVVAVALCGAAWLRGGLEPSVQAFVQGDLRALPLATEVALAQHLIKVFLGMSNWAVNVRLW